MFNTVFTVIIMRRQNSILEMAEKKPEVALGEY